MEVSLAHLHKHHHSAKGLGNYYDSGKNVEENTLTTQPTIEEKKETTVKLSPESLTMLDTDKAQNDKSFEQKQIEYIAAKKDYQNKVNDLPMDYRKMKIVKGRINQEIKDLKAEVASIEQSITLDKEEKEQAISVLENQIAVKSSAIIDIGKEFTQKLKDDERRKLVSPWGSD